jgi:hypothetical protein
LSLRAVVLTALALTAGMETSVAEVKQPLEHVGVRLSDKSGVTLLACMAVFAATRYFAV